MGTCRKEIKQDDYDLCIRSFPDLLEVMKSKGHIDYDVFNHPGSPVDEDTKGHKIRRDSNGNQ